MLKALLAPYPSDAMICWPVSARVGNVRDNDLSLIEPVAAAKRPVCPEKSINLDDHRAVLLDIGWTIEFFPLARLRENPGPPCRGFHLADAALRDRHASPVVSRRLRARLTRRRPRGARRRSGPRADRPRCDRRASPQAPPRRGARACAVATRRIPAGSPRPDRAGRNRRASCSGSGGRPRMWIHDGIAGEARRHRFEIGDFAGRIAAGHSVSSLGQAGVSSHLDIWGHYTKCSECTTSWTKHERAARWMSAPPSMAAARAAGVMSLTCQELRFSRTAAV